MKNKPKSFILLILLASSFVILSFNVDSKSDYEEISISDIIDIPADVQSIIDNKCYDCHNTESKGSKSKMKLNFDKFTNGKYAKGKLVSKLGKITKQLNKKKMPPEKHLKKYPEHALTEDESKLMIIWATKQSEVLVGE